MSALTQTQWYTKLKKFVPSWYFTNEELSVCFTAAVFQATAAMFSQIQNDTDDQQIATFILESSTVILDMLGDERNLPRNAGEIDAAYAIRIQNCLFTPVSLPTIQTAVNAVLNNGSGFFIKNLDYGFYDDPDLSLTPGQPYYDDANTYWLDHQKTYNWWTLIVPPQTGGSQTGIMAAIIAAIEANIAFGTTYDVLYQGGSIPLELEDGVTDLLLENGNQIYLE